MIGKVTDTVVCVCVCVNLMDRWHPVEDLTHPPVEVCIDKLFGGGC